MFEPVTRLKEKKRSTVEDTLPLSSYLRGVLREHSDLYTTNKFGNDVSPFDPKLDTSESVSSAANIFRVGENERLQ
ncbi:hypothetical protein HZH68_004438 [Vespula germanica]|uniref:Uncharacterized protein n=1 Tax=Vespula germanica TaxID=30212 RepID=A0A834NHZ6_VESGE|nr:hypothetical protein HZH68_004438 [Vespula germanica]